MTPRELKAWRESLGFSQLEFSQWLKPTRTPGLISLWETGRNSIPMYIDQQKELHDLRMENEMLKGSRNAE